MKINSILPRLLLASLTLLVVPVISQAQPNATLMQNNVVANGNGTSLNTDQRTTAAIVVNCISCSGGTTFNFEGTINGTDYASVTATKLPGTTTATSATTSGVTNWTIPVAGLLNVRVRVSAYSAGTVLVTGTATNTVTAPAAGAATVTGDVTVVQPTGTNLHVVVDSGGGGGTQYTNDGALTVATTIGTMGICRASAAVPSGVSADDDAAMLWCLRSGALGIQPTFAGVLGVAGNGASGTGVQRVTIANDSTGILAGVTTVSTVTTLGTISNALPAGTNNIGKVDIPNALPAGSALIGDVNVRLGGTAASVSNGTVGAQTQRVTIASDSTGVLASIGSITTSITPGTGATNEGKAIDNVVGATDTGVLALAMRKDTPATITPADGDYTQLRVNSLGALYTAPTTPDAAEDAAVATNPVPMGGVYRTASVTLDNGDVGYPRIDVDANLQIVGTGTAATPAGGVLSVTGGLATNGAAAATNRLGVLPAIAQSNMPAAATAGRDIAARTDLQGNTLVAAVNQTSMTSFAASKVGLATVASPTDIAVLSGNATNTVIVNKIIASCTQTTAGIIDIRLLKRTTADSGGTSTNSPTAYGLDSANASAVSAVLTYTANPTVNDGTDRVFDSAKIGVLAAATAGANDVYVWTAPVGSQALILRGTAQQAALNLNGVTLTGGSCDITYIWTETTGL